MSLSLSVALSKMMSHSYAAVVQSVLMCVKHLMLSQGQRGSNNSAHFFGRDFSFLAHKRYIIQCVFCMGLQTLVTKPRPSLRLD